MPIRSCDTNIVETMYTIQFGSRAHFLDDEAAAAVLAAMHNGETFITVPIDLAGDGDTYTVTLNVHHVVALIKHRASDTQSEKRPALKLVAIP